MKRSSLFVMVLLAAVVLAARPFAQTPRTIDLQGNDQMKYNVTTINAKPGESLHVRLKNVGSMPKMAMSHNFVLLKAGVDPMKFVNDSMMAGLAKNYVADSVTSEVVAHTVMAGPGETVEVTFKAPTKPGTYTYLCSFPGHYAAGMKGTFVVK